LLAAQQKSKISLLRSTASPARTYGGQGGQKSQKFEPAMDKAGRRESSAVRVIDWFMFRHFVGAELCARFDSIPDAAMAGHQRALQLFLICPANFLAGRYHSIFTPTGEPDGY